MRWIRNRAWALALLAPAVAVGAATPVPAAPPDGEQTLAPEAQTPAREQVLTNADVLALIDAGLPQSVLAAKIAAAPAVRFDTSAETLVALSKRGVDAAVLTAMVQRASRAGAMRTNFQDTPCEAPGMFVERDDALHALDVAGPASLVSSGVATDMANVAITAVTPFFLPGIIPSTTKIKLRGAAAAFRITEREPTFLLCVVEYPHDGPLGPGLPGLDPAGMQLVALRVRKRRDERLFNVGKNRVLGGTEFGIPAKQLRDIAFSEVKPGVYRVRAKQPLAPGEYGFYYGAAAVTGAPVQPWMAGGLGGRVFAFGVDKG